ncbi:endothelin-converting enzyme 1-like [Dermacentor silvarum]|uniref:endothelin-converting enzyme 1-like n=1 Tax=Dermacentor silvarum TaxID=543639 RepID=UPI00189B7271|nr:endothelin-converting enzyme 1-like [Dermacentor silvarum]
MQVPVVPRSPSIASTTTDDAESTNDAQSVHVMPTEEAIQDARKEKVVLPMAAEAESLKTCSFNATRSWRFPGHPTDTNNDRRSSSSKLASGTSPVSASSGVATIATRRSTNGSKGSVHSSLPPPSPTKKHWQVPPSKHALEAMRDFSPYSSFASPRSSSSGGATSQGPRSSGGTTMSKGPTRKTLPRSVKTSVAAVLVVIVTGAVMLIWLVASYRSSKVLSDGCRSEECYQYAKRLRESLNESVDPCADFTRYVCDGWRRKHEFSVAEEAFLSTFDKMSRFVRGLEVQPRGQSALQRAAAFYRSCVGVLRGERDEMPRVKRALAAAGITWPFKPEATPDLLHTLLYVHLQLHWSVLFSVNVSSSASGRSVTLSLIPSVEMAPFKKRLELIREPQKAREYFYTLASAFGAHAKQGSKLVTFKNTNKIETIALGALSAGFLNGSATPKALSASSLLETVPNLTQARWEATFSSMGITKKVLLATTNPTYVKQLFALWSSLGESRLHLFLSWYTIQIAALYTNRLLVENFYGSQKTAILRHGAFCFSKAYLLSGSTVFSSSVRYVLVGDTRVQAERLLWSVRDAFSRSLQSWPYNDNDSIAKLLALSERDFAASALAVFDENNVAEEAESQDSNDTDTTSSLVDDWITAAVPYRADIPRIASMAIEKLAFTAQTADGKVVLMPYAFSFPFFDLRGTPAMNYAGVGFHFAKGLSLLTLIPYIGNLDGPLYQFYNCTGVSYQTAIASPGRFLGAFSAFATQPLFDAFANASANLGTSATLPGLPALSGSQLFFVSLCYAKCHGSWTGELSEPECGDFLPHVEAFSKAFSCPVGSPMKPVKKCELF